MISGRSRGPCRSCRFSPSDSRVMSMDYLRAIPRQPRGAGRPGALGGRICSPTSEAEFHGPPASGPARSDDDRGRPRPPRGAGGMLIAVAVALLAESLLGRTWAVLGPCLLLGIAACGRAGHRLLLAASSAA